MPSEDGADSLSDKVITTELQTLTSQQAMLRSASVLSEVEKLSTMAQQLSRNADAETLVQVQLAAVYPFLHKFSELLRAPSSHPPTSHEACSNSTTRSATS